MTWLYLIFINKILTFIFIKLIKFFYFYFYLFGNIKILYYFNINFKFFNIKLNKIYKLVIINSIC